MTKFKKYKLLILLTFAQFSYSEGQHQIFNLGDFSLESGTILPNAKLSYVTHGELNEAKIILSSSHLPILEIIMGLIFSLKAEKH